jgi:hypothetical protein
MADVRRFGDEAYSWVSSNLSPGEYSLYTSRDEVPEELRSFTASGSTGDFVALLVLSGTTGDSPSRIRDMEVPAGSRVASMRRVRRDRDRKGYHLNTDDTLLWPDSTGGVWKAHPYRDDHRISSLSTEAGLDAELDPYNLDPGMSQRGPIASLRERGVLTPFSTGS